MTSDSDRTGFGNWLATIAAGEPDIGALHRQFCERLRHDGVPIWRSSLGLELLHPELSGYQFTWTDKDAIVSDFPRAGIAQMPQYRDSPMRVVDETDRPFRRRLMGDVAEMPLLAELQQQGATDYVIFPLGFIDRYRSNAISFATHRADGFGDGDIEFLETCARLISPYAERYVLRQIALDLLDTYVGRRSGRRVFEGTIERGQPETINAVIWLADLRGFTKLSDSQPGGVVLATLNDWFEAVVDAVTHHDGEVLKFIGDAVLAIFPAGAGALDGPCRRAVEAAQHMSRAVEGANRRRAAGDLPAIEFGLALHVGEVAYGNVGGRRRLDFTVIGSAVNQTSRLQELTRKLGEPILVSADFARAHGGPLRALGAHSLRSIAEPVAIFAL